MGKRRGVYGILVGKPEGMRLLRRTRIIWGHNIKLDLQKEGCGGMNWNKLTQEKDSWWALVNVVINLRFPQNTGNFLTS
jgi:hypothetical protein